MSELSQKVFETQIKRVQEMKARGSRPEDILDMEPGLAEAVQEVFEMSREDITASTSPRLNYQNLIGEDVVRYIGREGGGSGSIASPVHAGDEIAA